MRVSPAYQNTFRELGLTPEVIFTHPAIKAWRKLPDRENCTLDMTGPDGRDVRLHVKRFPPARGVTQAEREETGLRALALEKIPAPALVAWAKLPDGRSFVITEDLAGYQPADKLIEAGTPFDLLRDATADLAAKLHSAGLHHRDLYLCHFFVKMDGGVVDVKLIDAARVARLPGPLTRRRWIVKDLAQFWYSTTKLPIQDEQRAAWLARYGQARKLRDVEGLHRSVERKVKRIAAHDVRLNLKQPNRNISIPN